MLTRNTSPMANENRFLVIDDHEAVLAGTLPALQQRYPQARIATATSAKSAKQQLAERPHDFVVVDLHLPETRRATATVETGMKLLRRVMDSEQAPNIMVLSVNVKPLLRIKSDINGYEGGFVAIDKALPMKDMLDSIDLSMRGSTYLPLDIRSRPEFDSKWLSVLQLKYHEGLSDIAIARRLGISDRTVRNYWVRIQDTLEIYDDPDSDLRVQIQLVARRAGLID